MRVLRTVLAIVALALSPMARAQSEPLTPEQVAAIDENVAENLAHRGVPSASVAIVRGGSIVFAKAYGRKAVAPDKPADVSARYNIGSVTKQMTATALLMLVDQGKLSLDDTVDRWLPELNAADKVTVRQVLSHTAGYKGYRKSMPIEPGGDATRDPATTAHCHPSTA